ncbi:MAG: anaerobic glycerol-3-phosphate dehydrogenase subunit C [Planctomycetes bacterium]|nr:anaerobic glycerol-3-phosphate dehydrogenase subunit C [Planctomycetota bacterium]
MDHERERIQADLRGLLDGEVRCDDVFVRMYASDASIYEVRPLGVVRPRGLKDVVACVKYAADQNLSLHARGAGSGVAGAAVGPGLVLDFSHAMRRILSCGQGTARVQPGVVCSQLNRHLAQFGRLFGPNPASAAVSTIGGMLAADASGSRWLRYGSAGDSVVSLQLVLADGSVVEASVHPVEEPGVPRAGVRGRREELVHGIAGVLKSSEQVIARHAPATCIRRAGYRVHDVLRPNQLDLARLVAGSEGTLALITEATVRTEPLPKCVGLALLFSDRLESAARGALEVAGMGVVACDLLDRRLLSIARESDVRHDLLIPRDAEAMLSVEMHGDNPDEVRQALQDVVTRIQRRRRLAFDARLALEEEEVELFRALAQRIVPGLYRLKGASRPVPFVEDIGIPPAAMPEFLVQMQNVLKAHQVTAALFAHAAHGQLHVRPFLDLRNPAHVRKMQDVATDLYERVLAAGGLVGGGHGYGLSRSWFVRRQSGPLFGVFRQVKQLFDPRNILNPGKIAADYPQSLTTNVRPPAPHATPPSPTVNGSDAVEGGPLAGTMQLNWSGLSVLQTAGNCNGCGGCRSQLPLERMCPIFRYGPREEASPRAKANLMRAVLTGQMSPAALASDELKEVADLCVHCHQCRLECPAAVDIPKLMVECKAHYVATNGLTPTDWFLARIDRLSAWGSRLHLFANWAIGNRQMRWLIERLLGVAQGRKLPRFAARAFVRRAHRRRLTRPTRRSGRKVLFFVDVYANWHDVQLADAFVAVFEHNGIAVYVPPHQMQSGMAAVSMGAIDVARRFAQNNVRLLAEAVRQGYHVVTAEPAAALCLKHEYPHLLDDDDTRLVAENVSEACTYLWRLHQDGELELDLKPVNVSLGYHLPCHLRALNVGSPGYNLLRLIPGLTVVELNQVCSGMAGTYGLRRATYRGSLRAGWGLIAALRSHTIQAGITECSACKMQMEQGTTKPTIHPLKVLALSYGIMPEVAAKLTACGEELVVT